MNPISPKQPKDSLSQETAVRYLEEVLLDYKKLGQVRLPPIRALAKGAHVGYAIMSACVAKYRLNGQLMASPKQGLRLVELLNSEVKPKPPGAAQPRWQALRSKIETDLISGIWRRGIFLPGVGELSRRYSTSYPTVRKALNSLVANKVLEQRQTGFFVVGRKRPSVTTNLLFISRGMIESRLLLFSDRIREFHDALLRGAADANLRLIECAIDDQEPLFSARQKVRTWVKQTNTLGLVIWKDCFSTEFLEALIEDLRRADIPLVIIDEGVSPYVVPGLGQQVKVFQIASKVAGFAMGRFLLERGHTHIAFISSAQTALWSWHRLSGLQMAYSNASLANGVQVFGGDWVSANGVSSDKILRRNGDKIDKLLLQIRLGSPLHSRSLQSISLHETLMEIKEYSVLAENLQPVLEKIIADKRITTLVAAQDSIGVLCQDLMSSKKPNSLDPRFNIVGFDDSRRAQEYGMSSYNFDLKGLAHQTLAYILHPKDKHWKTQFQIEIPGFIMDREKNG